MGKIEKKRISIESMGDNHNTIVVIGELLWDILPDETILGGAPANLAYRLNSLGEKCYLISRIGTDNLGKQAMSQIKNLGLDTSFIQIDRNYPTGTVQVSFDNHRNPSYVITPQVAYDFIEFNQLLESIILKADLIAFGTLVQRSEITRATLTKLLNVSVKAIKFLDINLRKDCYNLQSVSQSLRYADILKTNYLELFEIKGMLHYSSSEIPSLAKEISHKNNIQTVLVTMEERGVFLYDRSEGSHYVPGFKINLEDPLGAGDAFSAAFIYNHLRRKPLVDSCIEGNKMGALVATQKGATQKIMKDELDFFALNKQRVIDTNFTKYLQKD